MSGQDLRVLATAFEQCQGAIQSHASSITELGAELRQLQSVLGDKGIGGDRCSALAQQVDNFSTGLEQLGGARGVGGVADGLGKILGKFQEVDRAQAANPHVVVRRT